MNKNNENNYKGMSFPIWSGFKDLKNNTIIDLPILIFRELCLTYLF